MPGVLGPELRCAVVGRFELARVEQLERAHDARASRSGRPRPRPRARAGEHGVQRGRARRARARAVQRSRTPSGGGGRRSSSASAARRYRPVPPTTIGRRAGGEQPVDLGVRELGVLADAEARVDRAGSRPAGARAARARAGSATPVSDLEALVDLQRVGGDGHRILAARAQALGQRDGDVGLADAGRAEERDERASRPSGGSIVRTHVRARRCRPLDAPRSARSAAHRGGHRGARGARRRAPSTSRSCSPRARTCAAPEATLEGVDEALAPAELVGCGAGGVLADGREVEEGTAVAVWAATLGDGAATTFHATIEEIDDGVGGRGMPDLEGAAAAILLARPRLTFPTEPRAARSVRARTRRCRCSAAWLSAATPRATARSSAASEVVDGGAVGVRFDGVEVLPCVSQGAAPVGPGADDHRGRRPRRHELAGRPALDDAARGARGLSATTSASSSPGGLLVGHRDRRRQARLRARRLPRARADRRRPGRAARSPSARWSRPGQVVRLHARDAAPRTATCARRSTCACEALGGRRPPARCVFTCNGRGARCSAPPTTTPPRSAEVLAGAPAPGSSPRARSAPSAARTSCTASPRPSRCSPGEPVPARARPAHRGDRRRSGRRSPRALAARGRTLVLTRPAAPARCSSHSPRSWARAAVAVRPRRPRGGRRGCADEAAAVDVLVANAALPASGRLDDVHAVEQIDRALDVNLRAPIAARARCSPSAMARAAPATSCSSRRCRARRPRPAPRSTRRRSSACAASRSGCARTCARTASASPSSFPGLRSATPACSPSPARSCPPFVGHELAPSRSRAGVVRAIEHNRAEVDVAPLVLRAGAFGGAPAAAPSPPRARGCEQPRPAEARVDGRRDRRGASRQKRAAERSCRGSRSRRRRRGDRRDRAPRRPAAARRSADRRGGDAHHDLVAVDLLERDVRLAAGRRR